MKIISIKLPDALIHALAPPPKNSASTQSEIIRTGLVVYQQSDSLNQSANASFLAHKRIVFHHRRESEQPLLIVPPSTL